MATHNYLGNYPDDHKSNWSDNLQGVTHDAEHWFFTQKTKLLKFHVTTDLTANSDQAVAIATMPAELASLGCNHFGDLDYFEWQGEGYLFVPVEGDGDCGVQPVVAVFRNDRTLTYVGHSDLQSQTKSLGTARAGWCAISPLNNLLHSSSNEIKANLPVFRYVIDFEALQSGNVFLTPESDLVLRENSASNDVVHLTKYVQGGTFSPDGSLYLSNGKMNLFVNDEEGGIHIFDPDGILQDRSSVTKPPFKYEFHNGFWKYEEPEGLTYWDIDALQQSFQIPQIDGQLHAILLDNNMSDDEIFFKHYRVA